MKKLRVNEIFYSLQGEGARAGCPTIFIRLAGCNLSCPFCDTSFDSYEELTVEEIDQKISQIENSYGVRIPWITWTGGEPTLQLTDEVVEYFKPRMQAIESNGTRPIPNGLDYVTISPKKGWQTLKNIHSKVNEIRYPINILAWQDDIDTIPPIEFLPIADHYCLSPVFLGDDKQKLNPISLNKCIDYILKVDPRWRLSVQQHKIWQIA